MEKKKFTLTISSELLEQIKEMANRKGMSVSEYILLMISQDVNNN